MYSIEFSETAAKQLNKLEEKIQERVIKVLERIKVRPHYFVKKLVGTNYFRLRIGDYRAILLIEENKIFVVEVGHRKNIYD